MVTIVIMVGVAALAGGVALWQRRLHRPAPTSTVGEPPSRLDRHDFRAPEAPWLVAVFTSATCASCEAVWSELVRHESSSVVTQNVEVGAEADLHERYSIDSVPTAVIVDRAGQVAYAVVGPLAPADRSAVQAILSGDD